MVFRQSTWKIKFNNFIPAGIYLLKSTVETPEEGVKFVQS